MPITTVDILVQLDGKYYKTITVGTDASKTMIETSALKAVGLSCLQAKVVQVPGRLANVISNRTPT